MRHDQTSPFDRIFLPRHTSVSRDHVRMIAEIDQWLEEDEKALCRERFYRRFETCFTGALLALIVVLGIVLVTYNTWRLIF